MNYCAIICAINAHNSEGCKKPILHVKKLHFVICTRITEWSVMSWKSQFVTTTNKNVYHNKTWFIRGKNDYIRPIPCVVQTFLSSSIVNKKIIELQPLRLCSILKHKSNVIYRLIKNKNEIRVDLIDLFTTISCAISDR